VECFGRGAIRHNPHCAPIACNRWQRFSELALSEETIAKLAGSCDEFLVRWERAEESGMYVVEGKWANVTSATGAGLVFISD
jgi:hypothetical protein